MGTDAMNATAIMELGIALTVVAAALAAFNALVGKGPRGTVWLVTAAVLTWTSVLPVAMCGKDHLPLSREIDLIIAVLRLCGAAGIVVGLIDAVQQRANEPHPIAEFIVRQPVVWGVVCAGNFFYLLFQDAFHSPWLMRYCGGLIEMVALTVFFIALSALVLRFFETLGQFPSLRGTLLAPIPAGGQPVDACEGLLAQLAERASIQKSYIVRRLHEALEFVRRKNSADALDQHLRHLEELESVRINAAYSMVRIIIWAIPILGLLGTVMGITIAVAHLNPETLEASMTKVTQGLGMAFDHTATALSLTMVLMFIKAGVERLEDRLLAGVDERVSKELVGRFQQASSEIVGDPNTSAIRQMSGQVVEAIESLAGRQADIWKSTIDEAHEQWLEVSVSAAKSIKTALATAVEENVARHAQSLNEGALKVVDRLSASTSHHAEQLDRSTQQTAERLRDGLEKLAELLIEAMERHGEVMSANEKEIAEQNRQHLTETEAALGASMASAADRQEKLIRQSEDLLQEMQIALVEATGAMVGHQEQLVRQGEVLLKVVDATGQIKALEESLAQNLSTIQKTHNFEEMAINLSAAIQLLSARLGHYPPATRLREVAGGDTAKEAA
jgi:biopolymer transport protein ExbB/TolQ/ElaB/YqjD/DUF883 family membrane-anchored ribosome-binding protein